MKNVFLSYTNNDLDAYIYYNFLKEQLPIMGLELINDKDYPCLGKGLQKSIADLINKCNIFICFFNKENPNIMFELGYALGKNKKIIVIGNYNEVPFDVRNMIYIQRGSQPYELLNYLEKYINKSQDKELSLKVLSGNILTDLDNLVLNPEVLDNIDDCEFESMIADWFKAKGYNVEKPYHYDTGYDFRVSPFKDSIAIVEVKKYKMTSQVPASVIRQIVGAMALEKVPFGIVISSAPFTQAASYFALNIETKVFLWTLSDLIRMNEIPKTKIEEEI